MKMLLALSSLLLLSGLRPCLAQPPPAPPTTAAPPSAPPKHVLFQAPDDDAGGILPNALAAVRVAVKMASHPSLKCSYPTMWH